MCTGMWRGQMQVELLGSADDDGNGDAIVEPVGDDLKSKAAANLCVVACALPPLPPPPLPSVTDHTRHCAGA